ncbi:hypothetical protein Y032_0006g3100 [Ancylostoma ceylanicum]|uniref:Bestrophin homolog n=1 Tax=Ancylostoma ceylanicum TaxID=53326 RepID=A0A016VQ04_9BILA|nr:hypothetical protein Y032_0006g3100 [Ancylostoma ceylanicum]
MYGLISIWFCVWGGIVCGQDSSSGRITLTIRLIICRMTVNYMQAAATAKVGTFLKLLLRWRGSVWKIVWKELTIFLFLYFNLRWVISC